MLSHERQEICCAIGITLLITGIIAPIARNLPKWQGLILISIPAVIIIVLLTYATLLGDSWKEWIPGCIVIVPLIFGLCAAIYSLFHSWLIAMVPAILLVSVFCIAAITRKKADNSSLIEPELTTETQEMMPHSHRLILDGLYPRGNSFLKVTLYGTEDNTMRGPSHTLLYEGKWLLEWDDHLMILKNPHGKPAIEIELSKVHQIIELHVLYAEKNISFIMTDGLLKFKKGRGVVSELNAIVEKGLRSDTEYRKRLRYGAARVSRIGLGSFILGGGLLGLFCWFASWVPNPPPGHWIRWVRGFVYAILPSGLMYTAIYGLYLCYNGIPLWRHLRRIERLAAK
jgi:hypothetical protein